MNLFVPSRGRYICIIAVSLAIVAGLLLYTAGVTADAYITFRVVDNAVHGYGLRWNIDERVEVYTHPLWMLMHIPFHLLWENMFYITVGISVMCTLGALILSVYTFRKRLLQTLALFIIPLAVSPTFMVSSNLGLENPLTHLLFAFFGWALFRAPPERFWFWISLAAGLSLMTRLDTIVFYVPVLVLLTVTHFRSMRIWQCLAGALPFIAWELFSLCYYGFLLPNTAYAKLPGSGIDWDTLRQGWHYLLNFFVEDMIGAGFLLAATIGLPLYAILCAHGRRLMRSEYIALAVGVWYYNLYVVYIGGTYIGGRFLSLQLFASVWIIYAFVPDTKRPYSYALLSSAMVMLALLYPREKDMKRLVPAAFTGDISPRWYHATYKGYPRDKGVWVMPMANHLLGNRWVGVFSGVGFGAYEAGPSLYAINPFGFTDPLLARLPASSDPMTRSIISHWWRTIPRGYERALRTGSLDRMDPSLATYYGKLRLIVSGDVWSWDRWCEIMRFNLGKEDYLLNTYLQTQATP